MKTIIIPILGKIDRILKIYFRLLFLYVDNSSCYLIILVNSFQPSWHHWIWWRINVISAQIYILFESFRSFRRWEIGVHAKWNKGLLSFLIYLYHFCLRRVGRAWKCTQMRYPAFLHQKMCRISFSFYLLR